MINAKENTQMKIYKKEITVYDFEGIFDGFCVEVQTEEEETEVYLYHKEYGIKSLMFGILNEDIESEEVLRDIIADYIEDNVERYRIEFMDE